MESGHKQKHSTSPSLLKRVGSYECCAGRATTLILYAHDKYKKLFIPLKTIYSKSIYSYYVLLEW